MPQVTLKKFDYPQSLIKSYQHWDLLLRPMQPTLGSMVLICKEGVHQYSAISKEAAAEQTVIIADIERVLKKRFDYSKINYLMLMMVDPAVHFHVIPRYESPVEFCDKVFEDRHWPNPPNLGDDLQLDTIYQQELLKTLKSDFISIKPMVTAKKYRRMYTSGCFDIFHQGHLNILKKTKELCDYLVVGVSTDEVIINSKGRPPIIPFEERISILEANRYVDEVIPQIDKNKQSIVDQYNIDAISVGSDWKGKYPPVSCDMVYFDYTPNVSSTVLKQKLNITPK
ncbi:adenylyltransferase/cytidyltransferase family protein [Shewanella sp. 5_MG-2023]|uniref:adenylyltransferase/cytidyltransferase family protein n=1 Tax=Shewanella sp. 5_MG-2023 TaxID=3062656 RepID=UPI0026E3496B|nr:adenylyltransferase/cytidyltransferase family protein [Shewanella sp. 5_MG-2023]MDO6639521.1 adenylyltransferase/cytidyltransferase family protein [Shewanella sp. 5_MG-2023]